MTLSRNMAKRKLTKRAHISQSQQKANSFSRTCSKSKRFKKNNNIFKQLAEESERFITNLSKTILSPIEKVALGKRLNFVPTPTKPNRRKLLSDFNIFQRRMRVTFLMHNKPAKAQHFKPPSKWQPNTTQCTTLENYLEATKYQFAHVRLRNQKTNMTKQDLSAITNLKTNPDIVIKPYDKGSGRGIGIMNRSDYLDVGYRHLESEHYTKLDQDITPQTTTLVQNLLLDMFRNNYINKQTLAYLDPLSQQCECPTMYFLPKIHTTPPEGTPFVGRPIISGCSSPTAKISEFVDYFILPIVTAQPTYIRDTANILRKLEK